MKTSEKLKARLVALGFDVTAIDRFRPGHWQRSQGAWVWQARFKYPGGGVGTVGTNETMAHCAKLTDSELRKELQN